MDRAAIRKEFPMLSQKVHGKPLVYLDSAATTLKPLCVIDAMRRFYSEEYGTVHRAIYQMAMRSTDAYNEARQTVRRFLNAAAPEEILFTKGTTDALNLVAACYGSLVLREGDEVLISQTEHHSNIVPWQWICRQRGATLKIIPVDERACLDMRAFNRLLSERTRIVSIAHISNAFGAIHPIQEIIALAHAAGAKVVIDAAQSAARLDLDVQALDADFLAFSGHKAYGPTGIGVLYGKRELLEAMPPYQGGGDMIDRVTFEETTYAPLPLKFEAGTPSIAAALGLAEALLYIKAIGLKEIFAHEQALTAKASIQLQAFPGIRIVGQGAEGGGILSFVAEGAHPLDIGTLLDMHGVAIRTGHHCAQPAMDRFHLPGTARISFGVYNTEEEVDTFCTALEEALACLR